MKDSDIKKISQAFAISEEDIRKALTGAKLQKENNKQTIKHKTGHSHLYFLIEDLDSLNIKIGKLHKEIASLGEGIGRSCDVSGETFHDNFDYEELSRQQAMWSEEIKKLTAIKRRAMIINPQENDKSVVSIGRNIIINNNGELMNIKVGSYMTFSSESVSYASPLIKIILGAKVGDIREGLIGAMVKKIEILEIK